MIKLIDLDIATKTIWGEARGEPYMGKKAVAHVLLNRWKSKKGQFRKDNTLSATCLRHAQFSCWNTNDPNLPKMNKLNASDKLYRICMMALLEAVDEKDFTNNAMHYHTAAIKAYWAREKKPYLVIGHHMFYVGIK